MADIRARRFVRGIALAAVAAAVVSSSGTGSAKTGERARRISASRRVVEVLERIERTLEATRYQHRTRVRASLGEYMFDCSGMATWVLRRSAPRAIASIGEPNGRRPLAVHFFRKIARIPPGERRGAWMRVASPGHARPGDLIAWKRPDWFPSKSTGHVAFVVGTPRLNTGAVPGVLVRVADASKFRHEDDSRAPGTTGYGTGVLLLPTDDEGRPLGYGWVGSRTEPDWVVPAELVIGRPLR